MKRRLAGAVSVGVVATALVAGPAGAAPPEPYAAGGRATALQLSVGLLNLDLTAADASAAVNSSPKAIADGQALATPLFSTDGAPSEAPGGAAQNESCEVDQNLVDLLGVQIACVNTTASVDGGPSATSNSGEIVLELGLPTGGLPGGGLPGLPDLGGTGAGSVTDLLEGLLGGLLGGLPGGGLPGGGTIPDLGGGFGAQLTDLLDGLLGGLTAGDALLRVTVAPDEVQAKANDTDGVMAHALSQGVVIEVLPSGDDALLTLTVGRSEVTVTRDAKTGAPTTDINPAPIDIQLGGGLLDILGNVLGGVGLSDLLNDTTAQLTSLNLLQCGNAANPLADIICLDLAAAENLTQARAAELGYDFGAGTTGGRASAVGIELLSLLNGGTPAVDLAVAESSAAANAPTAPVTPPAGPGTTPTDNARGTLPKTGSDPLPMAALGGIIGLALVGLVLTRRAGVGATR